MKARRTLQLVTIAALLGILGATASFASARSQLRVIPAAAESRSGVAVFKLRKNQVKEARVAWVAPRGLASDPRAGASSARARRGGWTYGMVMKSPRRRVGVPRLRGAAANGVLRLRVRGAVSRGGNRRKQRGRAKLVIAVNSAAPAPDTSCDCAGSASGAAAVGPTGDGSASGGADCASSSSGLGAFGEGAWPSGCWRPYSDESPFNQPIPASPRLHANSTEIVSTLTGWGEPGELRAGIADTSSDWDHPIYYSKATDPLFTLHCTEDWGTCEIEGHQIRIPQAARAAGGGDAHMTVIDQASGWEYDLYKYCYEGCESSTKRTLPPGGGDVFFRWGGRTRIDGDGLGSDATAAHFGLAAGVIRAEEMARGHIDHALFMVVRCDSGQKVWPANGLGSKCSNPSGAPAEGMRFQLAMTPAQVEALPVPSWKKTILRAMSEYGMYVGDTSGSTPWNIQFESSSSHTSFGFEDKLASLAEQVGLEASSDGRHYFDIAGGVDWRQYLRVIDPCVAQGTCA